MRYYKKVFFLIVLGYICLLCLPLDIYIKTFDCIRKLYNVRTVNTLTFAHLGVRSYIYSSLDSSDIFLYKIVEVERNIIGIPRIIAEADFYKRDDCELERIYIWKYMNFKLKLENSFNNYDFVIDTVITPNNSIKYIKSRISVSQLDSDSIIKSWD